MLVKFCYCVPHNPFITRPFLGAQATLGTFNSLTVRKGVGEWGEGGEFTSLEYLEYIFGLEIIVAEYFGIIKLTYYLSNRNPLEFEFLLLA